LILKTLPILLKTMSEASAAPCRESHGRCHRVKIILRTPAGCLGQAGDAQQALLDVIAAQKARYTVRELFDAAYAQEASERNGLFKIIAEVADESSVDDLIARIEGKDPVARLHTFNVLARFNLPKVQQAVQHSSRTSSSFAPRHYRAGEDGWPFDYAADRRDAARC